MRCPFCHKDNDRVIDSRSAEEGSVVRRRRGCLTCRKRFTTYEKVEAPTLYVIKKDGRRELFEREKIKKGIVVACTKRPVAVQRIEEIVSCIEQELFDKYDREARANVIGDLVMRELKRVDHVAYVRFASVYRDFQDLTEFIRALKPMLNNRRGRRGHASPDRQGTQERRAR